MHRDSNEGLAWVAIDKPFPLPEWGMVWPATRNVVSGETAHEIWIATDAVLRNVSGGVEVNLAATDGVTSDAIGRVME